MLSSYLSKETVESYAADEFYTHYYSLRSKPEKEAKEELAGAFIKGGSSLYEACNKATGVLCPGAGDRFSQTFIVT